MKRDLRVGKCQADAPKQRANEENRFHKSGMRIDSQGAEGEITG